MVLPTHVGVIPGVNTYLPDISGTTHTRGGDPIILVHQFGNPLYYPHTWGWSHSQIRLQLLMWVLPTHVGVILYESGFTAKAVRTTHTRGGDPG